MWSSIRERRPRSTRALLGPLLFVAVLLLVNLPLAGSTWQRWQLERSGVEVQARVAADRVEGARSYLGFVLPAQIAGRPLADGERGRTVEVEEDARVAAVAAGELTVRVLPSRPSVYSVEGQVRGSGALVLTLVADLVLLVGGLLLWRYRRYLRPGLTLVAGGDVQRCAEGAALERLDGAEYVVRGEVEAIEEDRLVLLVGERRVLVELDGRHNPVGPGQRAQVRGRMIG